FFRPLTNSAAMVLKRPRIQRLSLQGATRNSPDRFLGAYRKTSTRFCRLLGCNTQVLKKNKHVLANSFIVFIDRTPVFWLTAHFGFANSGQNGNAGLFPEGSPALRWCG